MEKHKSNTDRINANEVRLNQQDAIIKDMRLVVEKLIEIAKMKFGDQINDLKDF